MAFLRSFVEDEEIYDPTPGTTPIPDPGGDGPVHGGPYNPTPTVETATDPKPRGGGGGAAPPMAAGRPRFNFGAVPQFTPPQFRRPTIEDARNEPGFDFRLKGGSDALERSAAARGVLRTGGTLKDLVEYGQNFASQEYGNVFNRALQEYDRQYMGAKDSFAPRLAEWQLHGQGELASGLAAFDREWDMYKFFNPRSSGGREEEIEPPPAWPEYEF